MDIKNNLTANLVGLVGFETPQEVQDFWSSSLGSALRAFLGVLGILVVVYAVVRTIKNIAQGKIGEALKGVIGALLLAGVLFQPTLVEDGIRAASGVMEKVIETVSSIGGSSTDTGGGDGGGDGGGTDGGTGSDIGAGTGDSANSGDSCSEDDRRAGLC